MTLSTPYLVDLDYWFRVLKHGMGYYTARCDSSFRVSRGSWSVALVVQQFEDWKGFVQRFSTEPAFHVTKADRQIGLIKAKVNSYARAVLYRTVLKSPS